MRAGGRELAEARAQMERGDMTPACSNWLASHGLAERLADAEQPSQVHARLEELESLR